jgi:hypothetical protein
MEGAEGAEGAATLGPWAQTAKTAVATMTNKSGADRLRLVATLTEKALSANQNASPAPGLLCGALRLWQPPAIAAGVVHVVR